MPTITIQMRCTAASGAIPKQKKDGDVKYEYILDVVDPTLYETEANAAIWDGESLGMVLIQATHVPDLFVAGAVYNMSFEECEVPSKKPPEPTPELKEE